MASIRYSLQSKSDHSAIYLRLSLDRQTYYKRKIGLFIKASDWSIKSASPKQNTPENKNLNSKLKKLEAYIHDELNIASINGLLVDGNWLSQKIDLHFGRITNYKLDKLVEYGEDMIQNLDYRITDKGKKGVSSSTKKKYRTIVNKLIAFEKYKKKTYLIRDVDLDFRTEFIKYLSNKDKLSDNTIGRYLKFVKSICLDAGRNGIQTNIQLNHFKGFTVKASFITLSFDELKKLKETQFDVERLEVSRDWLIIGCYTGQRFSDLFRMKKEMIQSIQDFEFIVLEQEKTNKLIQIPIHEEVRSILNKRNGEFPPVYSKDKASENTKLNKSIKTVCKIAGLDSMESGFIFNEELGQNVHGEYEKYKLVTTHICRRSFASNFYGNPLYPLAILKNITGHSSERDFLDYIHKKPIDYSLQLAKIWANNEKKTVKFPDLKMERKTTSKG